MISYDPKCEELAEYFLPDADRNAVKSLAQSIQHCIEDELETLVRVGPEKET